MRLTYSDPFLVSEFSEDDGCDRNLFRRGYMIPDLDGKGGRVLDNEGQGRINNLLETHKSNATMKVVHRLFLSIVEVPKEPTLAFRCEREVLLKNCSTVD